MAILISLDIYVEPFLVYNLQQKFLKVENLLENSINGFASCLEL